MSPGCGDARQPVGIVRFIPPTNVASRLLKRFASVSRRTLMRFNDIANRLFIAALVALLTACGAASNDPVSRQDCERLRDHVVELRMQSVTADRGQHRTALRATLDDTFISSCVESTTADHLKCVLAAKDSDSLVSCSEPIPSPDPQTGDRGDD